MPLSNIFEKLGRAVFESPFESRRLAADAPELAEIRLTAIDAIKNKSHRVSGSYVFPFDLVRVHLLGIPAEQAPVFQSEFMLQYFAAELKMALKRSGYRFPENLEIEFTTDPRMPIEREKWISVEALMQPRTAAVPVTEHAPATLTVLHGRANQSEFQLEKVRTNIGRTAEVFHTAGPSRRNDIAFIEEDEAGRTVSREHAHIIRSATNEYRLFNDRVYSGEENCALWIVREGLSFAIHHSPRGTLLRPGDEIYLGTAVVRFSVPAADA